ncbi:hypothetical protein RFI_32846 [Reticulomyxa filosa]|uniref:Uncharacterized protein n=1 Tax=Reticulomyxa filosa TaxID=46433 RepID=X6LRP1_RETFI|nr:hypothetical protein RFI_32846 [Reticulomyxa filosa]|eukprot:ETO04553.1 hypothetical protein RFI_32846 [Reticulomyxa filosa]
MCKKKKAETRDANENLQADKQRFPPGIRNDLYNTQEQHTEFGEALNNTGRSMWLELCRGYGYPPPPYVAQVTNSWRVTGDYHGHWRSILVAIESVAGQTHSEYRSEFAIWGITASHLIVATDVRNIIDIMNQVLLNQEIFTINQQNETSDGVRLDINFRAQNQTNTSCQVWTRALFDGMVTVCYYCYCFFSSDKIKKYFERKMKKTSLKRLTITFLIKKNNSIYEITQIGHKGFTSNQCESAEAVSACRKQKFFYKSFLRKKLHCFKYLFEMNKKMQAKSLLYKQLSILCFVQIVK